MTDYRVIDRSSINHVYQQVADIIAGRIATGHYHRKLPSERGLADELGVSYITVRHAMAILRERGLVVSIHGRGTFIASHMTGHVQCGPLPAAQINAAEFALEIET